MLSRCSMQSFQAQDWREEQQWLIVGSRNQSQRKPRQLHDNVHYFECSVRGDYWLQQMQHENSFCTSLHPNELLLRYNSISARTGIILKLEVEAQNMEYLYFLGQAPEQMIYRGACISSLIKDWRLVPLWDKLYTLYILYTEHNGIVFNISLSAPHAPNPELDYIRERCSFPSWEMRWVVVVTFTYQPFPDFNHWQQSMHPSSTS